MLGVSCIFVTLCWKIRLPAEPLHSLCRGPGGRALLYRLKTLTLTWRHQVPECLPRGVPLTGEESPRHSRCLQCAVRPPPSCRVALVVGRHSVAGTDWQALGLFLRLSSNKGKGDTLSLMLSSPFESSWAVTASWKREQPCVAQRWWKRSALARTAHLNYFLPWHSFYI